MDALKKAIEELRKEQAKEKALRAVVAPQNIREFFESRKDLPRSRRRRKRKTTASKSKRTRPKAKKELSPSRRNLAWAQVMIRAEHHVMLRELAQHYNMTHGAMTGALIEEEYFLLLREIHPEKAQVIEKRYREEPITRKKVKEPHETQDDPPV